MYIRRLNAMNVPFNFETARTKAAGKALLDSGATDNFISEDTWKRLGVGRKKLEAPITVYNVDGTENKQGKLTYYCRLRVKYDGKEDLQNFYLTDLGKDRLILGFPFLHKFNPQVDWRKGVLKEGMVTIQSAMLKHVNKITSQLQLKALRQLGAPKEGEALYLRKVNIAQQMAKNYQAKHGKEDNTIPKEFQKYQEVFSEEASKKFPPDRNPNYRIEFTEEAPSHLNCKVYPLTLKETEALKKYIAEELDKGFIEPSSSPFTSLVFFRDKKDSEEKWLIIDYRRLNKFTKRDNGPLPRIDLILDQFQGMEIFSKFDIRWGFNNLPIRKEDRHKAAIKTPIGTFQSKVLTFGMRNGPAAFSRLMQRDFATWLNKWHHYKDTTGANYMDDFGIGSRDTPLGREGHKECIHDLLTLMQKHSYHLKPSKCRWMQSQMEFLGVLMKKGVMRIDPSKREGLLNWPRVLKDKDDVRRTMGMLQYQRRFIPGFSHIARPIFRTLAKGPFHWTKEAEASLDQLLKTIERNPMVGLPDQSKQFEMETDASNYAMGAVLFQRDENDNRIDVGYFSKALTKTQMNYDVFGKEYASIIGALRNWCYLLEGARFPVKIWTDHANLAKFTELQRIPGRIARYMEFMSRFDIEIHHLPGRKNTQADALSRRSDHIPPEGEQHLGIPLPESLFIRYIRPAALEQNIRDTQKKEEFKERLKKWTEKYKLDQQGGYYWRGGALVMPDPDNLAKPLLEIYHDGPSSGHPGQAKTYNDITRYYWWPDIKEFVTGYIQGCAICQENKINTRHNTPPLNPIYPDEDAQPFQTIAMDLIVKLPDSHGYDSILKIKN